MCLDAAPRRVGSATEYDERLHATYYVTRVDAHVYLVVVSAGKRKHESTVMVR